LIFDRLYDGLQLIDFLMAYNYIALTKILKKMWITASSSFNC